MLEGELTFQVGDELVTKRAGELAFAPRNVAAHVRQPRATRRRATCSYARPAGFERYFARMAAERRATSRPSGRCSAGPR